MTHCPSCEKDVHPVHEMADNGSVSPHCPNPECRVKLPEAKAESAQIVSVDGHRPVSHVVKIANPTDYSEVDVDILAMARQKLALIEAKIAVLSKLKGEAAGLRAMIAAAESANQVELS